MRVASKVRNEEALVGALNTLVSEYSCISAFECELPTWNIRWGVHH